MYLLKITLWFPSAFHPSLLFCVEFLFRVVKYIEYALKIHFSCTYLDAIMYYFRLFNYKYYVRSLLEYSFCDKYFKNIFVTLGYTLLICILLILHVIQF